MTAPTALRKRALAYLEPPFKYDGVAYIWSGNRRMVVDDKVEEDGAVCRLRGWGGISYEDDPEALQDEIGTVIAEALTEYWEKHASSDDEGGAV